MKMIQDYFIYHSKIKFTFLFFVFFLQSKASVFHGDLIVLKISNSELIVSASITPSIVFNDQKKSLNTPSFTPAIESNSPGEITFTSSDESVATVSGSTITIVGIGSTILTATQAESGNYYATTVTSTLSVYNDQTWIAELIGNDIDGEAAYDKSGYSVSLSSDGTIVAIGAPKNDGNGSVSGHVRVFRYTDSSWNQIGADIDGEALGDESGYSVSLSSDGTTVAIGAMNNDGNGTSSGHVRVYRYDNLSWKQLGGDIDGESGFNYSGRSVSLSSDGNIVAIGADGNSDNGVDSGHVRVYQYIDSNNSWSQLGSDINGEKGDWSGYSVSLSSDGKKVAIGSIYDLIDDIGKVRVYHYVDSNNSWDPLGSDIIGEAAYDEYGYSVDLSSNGLTVAIGAPFNDGANGIDSGQVRVYQYSGSSWQQLGSDIDGESANDELGYSVSLSSDGALLAVGAIGSDTNGSRSGSVRVYQYSGSSWQQLGSDIDGE